LQIQLGQQDEAEVVVKLTSKMFADLVQNWNQANDEMRRA
jgi:hypothetical protein